jgi:hypothetical protein
VFRRLPPGSTVLAKKTGLDVAYTSIVGGDNLYKQFLKQQI